MKDNYFELPWTKADLAADPIEQFNTWLVQAKQKGENEPHAMALATVNANLEVSVRMVLLKSFDQQGLTFFTHYQSPKALALKEVPQAAVVFWWPLCQRQVRISGPVELLSPLQSDAYFAQRERGSQLSAVISQQSQPISDRQYLLDQFSIKAQQLIDPIKRPPYWGGYLLQPHCLEFWQGRKHRLHDRFQYQKTNQGWEITQLSP